MSNFRPNKVVGSLPPTLEPNAVYFVRTGVGFDLYCTDQTGSIAHQINVNPAQIRAIEQTASFSLLGIGNGTYFIDERVPRALTLLRLRTLRNTRASGASFTFSLTNNGANITGVNIVSGSTVQLSSPLTASANNVIPINGSLAFVISGIASGTIDLLFSFDYTE
jgi:hypothetical protein